MSSTERTNETLQMRFFESLSSRWLPFPKTVNIEPINVCQLRCPLCPTGARRVNDEPLSMSLETFKELLSKLPFARAIDLHRAGEPFLNPETLSMIRYAAERGIHVVISTNFSFSRPEQFFEDVVRSGLGKLIVSLDGASPESYAKYRVAGDFGLVMANLKRVVAARDKAGSSTPEIVWQFLVNRFNEHEIAAAQEISRQLKITLDLRPLDVSDNLVDVELESTIQERKEQWLPRDSKYICDHYRGDAEYPVQKGICTEVFTNVAVTVDGKVLPCCGSWDKNSMFGDLNRESFEEIWYGRKYVNSRMRFFRKGFSPELRSICFSCSVFGTSPSFKDKLKLLKAICVKNLVPVRRR